MARGIRPFRRGELDVRAMLSAEPSMGPRGYPLLLQTGESADGETPLYDRQHPHDLVMEFGATYTLPIDTALSVFAYVAPVGGPAFGPVPYVHRAGGNGVLRAPISHHSQDASHITYGVITLGVVSERRLKFEVSAFNGREPDQRRWDVEPPRFDSYAVRVGANIGRNWTAQASVAQVASPERLHPGIDAVRSSASVTHNVALASGRWQTTLVFGTSKTKRTTIPVPEARRRFSAPVLQHYLSLVEQSGIPEDSLLLFFPERKQPAFLIESVYERGGWTAALRLEQASKAELFPPGDARHSQVFRVARGEASLARDILRTGVGPIGVGFSVSSPFVKRDLESEYGNQPSCHLFVRFSLR
jgi:hypothetical protein